MINVRIIHLIEPAIVGFIGGYLFNLANIPLPWVLGSLTFVMLWQGFSKRQAHWPTVLKDSGFMILGIYFGLYFTIETFLTIGPYLLPYLLVTFILIFTSIFISTTITRWIKVDKITSVYGSIPGG